jgi:AAA15 family ATPase/GTPase
MSQILKDLQICGFRGFQEINLSDLGPVNLIVGNNNSGKTSLLEAIAIFCNPLDPFRWFEISKRSFYSNRYLRYQPDLESIKWIFQKEKISSDDQESYSKLIIKASGFTPIKELEAEIENISGIRVSDDQESELDNNDEENSLNYENETNEIFKDNLESQGLELRIKTQYIEHIKPNIVNIIDNDNDNETKFINESFQFWEDERFVSKRKKQEFINTNIVSPAYSTSVSIVLSRLILSDQKNKDEILNLVRFFDEDIIDIIILSPRHFGNLYIEHKKLGLTPLDIFGDGIKKTLSMAIALQSAKDGILLIDEIETSIHVSALSQVFSWLVESCFKQNIQLFVTTHSIEAVDAIITSTTNIDNIVAFQLNNIDNSVKRFSGDLLSRLRLNRGLDIR